GCNFPSAKKPLSLSRGLQKHPRQSASRTPRYPGDSASLKNGVLCARLKLTERWQIKSSHAKRPARESVQSISQCLGPGNPSVPSCIVHLFDIFVYMPRAAYGSCRS
ncbi:unnamed protein product, partial [Mycena citricolor]